MNVLRDFLVILYISFLISNLCLSIDTITRTQSIKDGEIIVSKGEGFALGFFSPGNSAGRYVGIWYHKISEQTVVWVANRDNPISDTSGILTITGQGNLVLYDKNRTVPVWSAIANISSTNISNSKAQLFDSGNLVLVPEGTNKFLWQSFDYPTDTLLPFMKLGLNKITGKNWSLSSWKSKDDPGTGNVFFRIEPGGYPQLFLYKGLALWWRGGPWTGLRWSGVPEMTRHFIFNSTFMNKEDEVSITYAITNTSIFSRMMVSETGVVQRATWNDHDRRWIGFWSAPKEQCDNYGECGVNSNCDPYDSDNFICKCLPGFEPKSPRDWFLRDGSGGCVRKVDGSTCRSGEGFVKLTRVRVPDTTMARANMGLNLKACEEECMKNCSCSAYTSADERGIGCLQWYGDLIDTRTFSSVGQDIFIRVDAAELAKYGKPKSPLTKHGVRAILIVSTAVASFLSAFVIFCILRLRRKARDRPLSKHLFCFNQEYTQSGKENDEGEISDLPCFDLSAIAGATNNFSDDNKLGEGGFGSVYKGTLTNGQEIAVKRLSKNSGQGDLEFKNEVVLVAKLQHRNLVRLLGFCLEGNERLLIYEFVPNTSLDHFIFDPIKRAELDWDRRHNIIGGIARGLLYLHEDSRLRIIHRDMKASNILLDEDMNPKISDFGMARLFVVDQTQGNTNRIVGTYGYMAPEYAMHGQFSVKSDVFSFGVLLLEIVSGQKNSCFRNGENIEDLLSCAWKNWREGTYMNVVDPNLANASTTKIMRCIHIGLLCVQENVADRPTTASVVLMLNSYSLTLPIPSKPSYSNIESDMSFSSRNDSRMIISSQSQNEALITELYPR